MLVDEKLPTGRLEIFHPIYTMKRKVLHNYSLEELLTPIINKGQLVYTLPTLKQIRTRMAEQVNLFPPEVLRLTNPHEYHVDLSKPLWDLKNQMMLKVKLEEEFE
jgi:nicotinate phosphoribosyltransferase